MIPLRDSNPTRRTPVVTLAIIVACFVVFAWELGLQATSEASLDAFVTEWGVVPAELLAAWGAGQFVSQETATLITSQFLHGGWLHLLGNLLYLWIFGNNIEDRLGRALFVLFYLGGGVVAGLTQTAHRPRLDDPADRRLRRDRRDARRVLRPLPGCANHDPRLPRLLLPAHRGPGDHRPRLLVRAAAARRDRLARHGGRGRRGVLRPHRRLRGRRPRGVADDRQRAGPGAGEPRGIIRPCRTD